LIKIKWRSIQTEDFSLARKSRVTGNARNAELKLPNFLLNRLKTDLFTAKSAGQKEDQKGISTDNLKRSQKEDKSSLRTKNPAKAGLFVFHQVHQKWTKIKKRFISSPIRNGW
jgi:hypothetical protein